MPPTLGTRGLPIVVGVTGHRDTLPDAEAPLRAAFASVLSELKTAYPHCPLLVLSGLAAGADILAAEEAIARGVPVVACLPMKASRYEEDFSATETSRFREILAKCARIDVVANDLERRQSYVALGLYITHYSHVVIAFWDGVEGRGAGGTADVVAMRLSGTADESQEPCDVPYLPDVGPVYHVVTPHRAVEVVADPYTVHKLVPQRFPNDLYSERDFKAALSHLDLYDSDLAADEAANQPLTTLDDLFDRTDRVANRLQHHTLAYTRVLYVIAFLAASAQVLIGGGGGSIVKLAILAVAFVTYLVARRNDYENRYQDYRAIAEGLRVQSSWNSAGLLDAAVEACYLRMQQSELQWIRMGLRTAYLIFCRLTPDSDLRSQRFVAWIELQHEYYDKARKRDAGRKRAADLLLLWVIGVSGFVTVAALVVLNGSEVAQWGARALMNRFHVVVHPPQWHLGVVPPNLTWQFFSAKATWQFLSQGPLAVAGGLGLILGFYLEKRSFAVNARRYDRMFLVFDKAHRRLSELMEKGGREADIKDLVRDLGREALVEHADWLLSRRDRPLSFVHN